MYQVGKTLGYPHRRTPKTSSERSPARGPSVRGGSSIQHGSLKQPLCEKMCFFLRSLTMPHRRRIEHVDIIIASKCLYVWMGGGKRGYFGKANGLSS